MSNLWVAHREQSGRLYYVEYAQPSDRTEIRTRARWSRAGRVLFLIGITTNVLVLVPGFAAAVMIDVYTPVIVTLFISAAVWAVLMFAWRVIVQRIASRPEGNRRSAAEFQARQKAMRQRQRASFTRTRVDGDLEFPE
ncbi:hypothetical protein [Streptomyces sp. NPDC056061]|uniref:hypothetical protein n=1 Tax=Streptomyces sp. NPDC056061 TaxID=3345700 RepID=UPI0035D7B04E